MTNEITDMTMETASEVTDAVMDMFHTTGGLAMNTAHGALNTAQGVGNVAINTVDEVNKFVNSGFRPVTNFVNSGLNFVSPRFLNNNFFQGKKVGMHCPQVMSKKWSDLQRKQVTDNVVENSKLIVIETQKFYWILKTESSSITFIYLSVYLSIY